MYTYIHTYLHLCLYLYIYISVWKRAEALAPELMSTELLAALAWSLQTLRKINILIHL